MAIENVKLGIKKRSREILLILIDNRYQATLTRLYKGLITYTNIRRLNPQSNFMSGNTLPWNRCLLLDFDSQSASLRSFSGP